MDKNAYLKQRRGDGEHFNEVLVRQCYDQANLILQIKLAGCLQLTADILKGKDCVSNLWINQFVLISEKYYKSVNQQPHTPFEYGDTSEQLEHNLLVYKQAMEVWQDTRSRHKLVYDSDKEALIKLLEEYAVNTRYIEDTDLETNSPRK